MIEDVVAQWHAYLSGELPGGLDDLLDDDVVFYSPIVFTPQRGKETTSLYLQAAGQTFAGSDSSKQTAAPESGERFHYTKKRDCWRYSCLGVRDHHGGEVRQRCRHHSVQ